jgi:hypothetical protein
LLDTVRLYYKVPLLGENINELGNNFSKKYSKDFNYNFYKRILNGYWKQLENKKEGVVRLHPTQLSFIPHSWEMVDFENLMFMQYDKIYFTVRKNIADNISSLFVATTLKKFTYHDKQEVHENIQPITLTSSEYFTSIEMLLYSEFVMNKIKEYLTSQHISWVELEYDDIPTHIDKTYKNTPALHVETEYDYRNIVTNYDELPTLYEQLKPEAYRKFCSGS